MNERSLKKQAKINKILDYGIEAFREKGYHSAGVQELADACNLSKGSFYQYFETKENFCCLVIQRYGEKMRSFMNTYFDTAAGSGIEVLKSFYSSVIDRIAASRFMTGCLYADMAAELGGVNELCSKTLSESMNLSLGILTEVIKKGQEDGSIRRDLAAEDLGHLLTSAFMGSILKMKVNGSTDSGRLFLDSFIGNMLSAGV